MATVNKNFRIKHGLVVEGATGTINGQNILTETGGDNYILTLIGGETLVKSVASGLSVSGAGELSIDRSVVDGWYDASGAAATAEQNAKDYADTGLDGKEDALTAAQMVNKVITGVSGASYGLIGTSEYLDVKDTNGYNKEIELDIAAVEAKLTTDGFASQTDISDAITDLDLSNTYDAKGAAATAQSNAEDYADGLAVNYDSAGAASSAQTAAQNYADGLAINYDPAGSASTAETNANSYTNTALNDYTPTSSLDTTIDGYGYLKSADLSGYATESYVGTAIDNLVDGAPGLLDTLNEIAAAINDDANYATTITTALSGKQDNLTASTGITIDGSNNISVTSNTYDAYGAAATAQSNAEDYADGLAVNYDSAGTAAGLVDDLKDATTAFTAINLNSVAKEVAVTATIATAGSADAVTWSASSYRTAKALIKFETAAHSQVSEVLLTLDGSNNIAITEYAEVGTNGSMGTVSASYNSGTVAITVTTVNENTDVTVKATLLA